MSDAELRARLTASGAFTWTSLSRRSLGTVVLVAADYLVLLAALYVAKAMRLLLGEMAPWLNNFALPFHSWMAVIPLLVVAFIAYEGLYTKCWPFAQGAQRLFRATVFSTVLIVCLLFLTHTYHVSRLLILLFWAFGFGGVLVERYFLKRLLVRVGLWRKSVLLVGAGQTASLLADAFEEDKGLGYQIVGVVEDSCEARPLARQFPCLGGFADLPRAIARSQPDEVIIAAPGIGRESLLEIVYQTQLLAKKISVVPDLYGMPLSNVEAETFFNQKLVLLKVTNNLSKPWNQVLKRGFDLILGAVATLLALPLMLLIAFLIKRDSPGGIWFNAERIGRGGTTFICYKFRTMYADSDDIFERHLATHPEAHAEWQTYAKLRGDDPRVTPMGKFLRRTSLDELPQLLNVLKGEMSLVGPRPYLPREKADMESFWTDIVSVPPGITGLWQVSGRNDISFRQRLEMDSWYVRNWSLWLDIVMLLKTIGVVTGKKGAY